MLLDLIESRPVIEDELEEIIRKEINSKLNPLSKASTNNEEEETDESKENSFFDKNKSIKSNSPFSSHFNEVLEKINKSVCTNLDESTTAN